MRYIFSLILTGMILSLLLPSQVALASCAQQTAEEQFAQAEIVAHGTITQIDSGRTTTTITAVIDEAMKGTNAETITFVTGYGTTVSTSVDFVFQKGAQYKLFLYRDQNGELTTNSCSGTVLISAPVTTGPTDVTTTTAVDSISYSWFIAAHLLALAVICIVLAIIFYRRNVRHQMKNQL